MSGTVKAGSVAIGAGHTFYTAETSVSPLVLLLRQIRQTIKATLPEITEIPEVLDAFPTIKVEGNEVLNTPFIVMRGKTPRPAEAAVGDDTQTLTFDFIYVVEEVITNVDDAQEYVRDRLVLLKRAFLANYRMNGYANATRCVQDPIDHTNQYKQAFAAEAQPVTALELVMEFDIIEALI